MPPTVCMFVWQIRSRELLWGCICSCKINNVHKFRKVSCWLTFIILSLACLWIEFLSVSLVALIWMPCQLDSSQLITSSTSGVQTSLTHSHMLSSALIFQLGRVMLPSHSIRSFSLHLHWLSFYSTPIFELFRSGAVAFSLCKANIFLMNHLSDLLSSLDTFELQWPNTPGILLFTKRKLRNALYLTKHWTKSKEITAGKIFIVIIWTATWSNKHALRKWTPMALTEIVFQVQQVKKVWNLPQTFNIIFLKVQMTSISAQISVKIHSLLTCK